MSLLRYVSHPDVQIDPAVPVPEWGLSEAGRRRTDVLLRQPWLESVGHVVASPERKARETADLVAGHLELDVEVRTDTGEIDRSATGFVSHERHEELADRLFADPDVSADGWETASDAQRRIVAAVADLLVDDDDLDVMVVGHGGVGTLLMCHLARLDIDRVHDQPGQGHHWLLDRETGVVAHRWRSIDHLD